MSMQLKHLEEEKVAATAQSFSSSHKGCQASVDSEPSGHTDQLVQENEQLMTLVRKSDGLVAQMQQMLEVLRLQQLSHCRQHMHRS